MRGFCIFILGFVFAGGVVAIAEDGSVETEVYQLLGLDHYPFIRDSGSQATDPFSGNYPSYEPTGSTYAIPHSADESFGPDLTTLVDKRDQFEDAGVQFGEAQILYAAPFLYVRGRKEDLAALHAYIEANRRKPELPMVRLDLIVKNPGKPVSELSIVQALEQDLQIKRGGQYELACQIEAIGGSPEKVDLSIDLMLLDRPGSFSIHQPIGLGATERFEHDSSKLELTATRTWGTEGSDGVLPKDAEELMEKRAFWSEHGPTMAFGEPLTQGQITRLREERRARGPTTLVSRLADYVVLPYIYGAPLPADPFASRRPKRKAAPSLFPGEYRPVFGLGILVDARPAFESVGVVFRPQDFAVYNLRQNQLFVRAEPDQIELTEAYLGSSYHDYHGMWVRLSYSIVRSVDAGAPQIHWQQSTVALSGQRGRTIVTLPDGSTGTLEIDPVIEANGFSIDAIYRIDLQLPDFSISCEAPVELVDGIPVALQLGDGWEMILSARIESIWTSSSIGDLQNLETNFHDVADDIIYPFPKVAP